MSDRLAGLSREEKLALVAELARKKAAGPRAHPLSFAQERLWLLHRLDPESFAQSLFRAFELTGELDEDAFAAAVRALVRRHGALRTTFASGGDDGAPRQLVAPPAAAERFPVAFEDLRGLPDAERETRLDELVHAEARRPFDLEAGPLFRVTVARLGERRHALLLALHHVVIDGWSVGILYRELSALYAAARKGREAALPELEIEYSDFARWQREELDLAGHLAFWRAELAGAPTVLELPTDRPRPALASLAGAVLPVRLGRELSDALRRLARESEATLFMTLLAVFEVLVRRFSGQRDFLLGTPIANRQRTELAGLIGSFANTLVVRSDVAGNPTFRELLARVRRRALTAYDHQDLPFERLVEELRPERDLSRNPLVQVMFAILDEPGGGRLRRLGDLAVRPLRVERGLSKVDLTLEMIAGDELTGYFEYATDLFERPAIERLSASLTTLLRAVVEDPDRRLGDLPLTGAEEARRLVTAWNRTAAACDLERPLHRQLADRARATPDAVAVVAAPPVEAGAGAGAAPHLTFGELHRRAAGLARRLRRLGVGRGSRVGVALERSPEALVAFAAVLEAGAAWVYLDPSLPRQRLAFLAGDAELAVTVTRERLAERLPPGGRTVFLDRRGASCGAADAPPEVGPDDVAYAIYTSGSTGRPKGVEIPHRAVVNHARAIGELYRLGAADRVLQFASLAFDVAVEELFPTWLAGAAVVLRDERQSLAFADFCRLVEDHGITVANLPTPYWHEWVSALAAGGRVPPALRLVIVGTEQALPQRLRAWLAAVGERPQWFNAYGPSEATVTATAWSPPPSLDPAALRQAPIGLPVANVRAHVVDEALRPVPVGVPGELLLGGAGLARGYLGQPRPTAAKFLPDPFAGEPGGRLYATGDRGRRLDSGALVFLGRLDQQVKIRGFRIEVGEIEAVLREHPQVREAVVVACEVAPGDRRLAAWAAPEAGAAPAPRTLRDHLARSLPGYMVPAAVALVAALPRTAGGKVDRRALPAPDWGGAAGEAAAPRSPQEEILVDVWKEVLGRGEVGVHDDFFELGGHSLLATRVLSRLSGALGVELPLRAIFEAPTVAALAARLDAARRSAAGPPPPIVPVPRTPAPPLSFAQQRMWFLHQLDPASPAYNMPAALRMAGPLDVPCLERALAAVFDRHESLRTTFRSQRGEPVPEIAPRACVRLPVVDLAGEADALELAREESRRPFDLAAGPLLRLLLLRVGDREHWLVFTFHHVVSDGWSTEVFLRDLVGLYHALRRGEASPLPELPVQHADFAAWQRSWLTGEVLAAHLDFWRRRLAGAPTVLDLPTDRPRPAVRGNRGGRAPVRVAAATAEALRRLGRAHGSTPFMTCLAAFDVLLYRVSHQRSLLVGTPVAGRQRPEIEGLIGLFVNTLVLRAELGGGMSFARLLEQVRAAVLDAYAHQDLPFERLVDELDVERDLSHTPLFQALFVLHHASPLLAGLDTELELSLPSIDNRTSRFDLNLVLVERPAGLGGFLEYDRDLFDAASAERLAACYEHLLAAVAGDAGQSVDRLPLFSPAQRAELLRRPNATAADFAESATVPELFARCARVHAERPALRFEGEELSYRELARRCARLARHLRARGVRRDRPVGVAMERSLELVTALVAVLEAGGAYVPLDPSYPASRLAFMIADSGVDLVLTQERLAGALPLPASRHVELLAVDAATDLDAAAPAPPPDDDHLAYVIYTSGSTGRPKGAMSSHGAIRNRLLWMQAEYRLEPGERVLQKTPFSFDVSVWEFFWPLITGATLVVARPGGHQDPAYLIDLIVRERVSTLHFVPSMLQAFLAARGVGRCAASLRRVIASGEALPAELVGRFYELLDGPRLHNLYGPTEAAVDVTYHACTAAGDRSAVPIGRPVANTAIYLVDSRLEPVPRGVSGELLIAGVQLARGYHGRPALTAARFVPDPLSGAAGARLYRSGDLARYLPGDEIAFLGRLDHQVKVRGFRIEPGEVEAVLGAQGGVREAVVMAREPAPGDLRLVAYVTRGGDDDGDALVERLRAVLTAALPDYMVPAHFEVLDALPLSPNGKVDRAALGRRPLPAPGRSRAPRYRAPRSPVEERLAAIWREVLRLERVGIDDNFFELGGHSLLATQAVARSAEAFDLDLPLRALFDHPTIAAFAREIVAREAAQADTELLATLLAELDEVNA